VSAGGRSLLAAGGLAAEIDPRGAELRSFRIDGREWLWQGDPAWWAGQAPLLFPVIGRSPGGRARWQGRSFEMPPHGVARQSLFALRDADARSARFVLRDDEATRAHYPFAFRLEVEWRIEEASLSMRVVARNPSATEILPASIGFHPAFAWPLVPGAAREAHVMRFDRPEPAPIRSIDADGLGHPSGLPTPVDGATLRLDDRLFAADALILDRLASRRAWFGVPGMRGLRVDFPDCPHLGIWTKPGAPYLCIEPWQGFAPVIGDDGDLARRPGIVLVPPGGALERNLVLSPDIVPAA